MRNPLCGTHTPQGQALWRNESLVRRGGVHIIQGHKDSRWAAVQNAALPQAGERGGGKVDVGG